MLIESLPIMYEFVSEEGITRIWYGSTSSEQHTGPVSNTEANERRRKKKI